MCNTSILIPPSCVVVDLDPLRILEDVGGDGVLDEIPFAACHPEDQIV